MPQLPLLALTLLGSFLVLAGCASVPGPLRIAEGGAGRAVIVVAADAPEPDRHAARELSAFLQQVTGAEIPVVHDAAAAAGTARLLVGEAAARSVVPAFTTAALGADGIILRSVGSDLILAGKAPRGTLYAVYRFLEDQVGCRWWSSKVSTIPKQPTLVIAPLDVQYTPVLEYREPFWFDAFDGDFAARNQANGHTARLDARRGGKHIYEGFVHTFYPLIPPEKYYQEHPDWFSLVKGKRGAGTGWDGKGSQLCLTNEEMRKELVKNLKEKLRRNPAATIASVSQNDWAGYCECEKCKAIDDAEGSHAGTLLRFVNAVAEDIEKEFPHVAIDTLAYQYTRKPPTITKPRPNVIVRLCSIECSFSVPLEHERNAKFRDDIIGWSKLCNRLYIWDYTTDFPNYIMPHPNLRVLGPNVKFFVNHGVRGLFEQGAYEGLAEFGELRAWVLAKLLWDPSRDADKLIDEFLAGYYGAAAPQIKAYLTLTHDTVAKTGDYLGCFSKPDAKFLSFATMNEGLKLLRAAEAAVAGDEALRQRVHVTQLPIVYTFLVKWNAFRKEAADAKVAWPLAESASEVYDQFMKEMQAAGFTHIREYTKLEKFANPVK